ncbi:MAG: transcription termination factor Rho, partial [Marmoricola sp.]
MPELKQIASGLGIKATGMKKADLLVAIRAAQGGSRSPANAESNGDNTGGDRAENRAPNRDRAGRPDRAENRAPNRDRAERPDRAEPEDRAARPDNSSNDDRSDQRAGERNRDRPEQRDRSDERQNTRQNDRQSQRTNDDDNEQHNDRDDDGDRQNNRNNRNQGGNTRNQGGRNQNQGGSSGSNTFEDESGRRNRRRRGRDRDRGGNNQSGGGGNANTSTNRGNRNEPDTTVFEDDVLIPAAGILDVLDNYAFVRTSGYLPGSDDCYVSLSMVRKLGLRRGDAITGQVRQPREGERKEKFNPMVTIDTVNGADPEASKTRVEFQKLTPLYASERLRLETDPGNLIGRVIDIAAPIGKGQRGLIVSPSKAGKTMIMQSIANSITTNNPECHLMVVLVDERPEEVTDFERSVKGEVISSTFDRPASDHTIVAELAIERAKRLVELGHDVVVLLDGITRLGRAYNLAAPASGRILSGGVDSAALYPPKRFFGAARNIEHGGSLTILATALIESGSKMDEVIFEEF